MTFQTAHIYLCLKNSMQDCANHAQNPALWKMRYISSLPPPLPNSLPCMSFFSANHMYEILQKSWQLVQIANFNKWSQKTKKNPIFFFNLSWKKINFSNWLLEKKKKSFITWPHEKNCNCFQKSVEKYQFCQSVVEKNCVFHQSLKKNVEISWSKSVTNLQIFCSIGMRKFSLTIFCQQEFSWRIFCLPFH